MFQANKTPQDINQFLQQVTPKIKELPQELQVMVLNASREFGDARFLLFTPEKTPSGLLRVKRHCAGKVPLKNENITP
ncbi:MAG: hypothetical protein EA361_00075 [Bacteroidetes bacterium]|nr:MAG: hypothetical protein EA361_00075 [Bacteroidota bacterium]